MEEQKAVAVQNNQSIANPISGLDGLEDIDASDLIIPRLQIVQPTSQMGATAGTIYNVATGEEFKELEIVFLAVHKSRVRWLINDDGTVNLKEPPVCRSNDSRNGQGNPGGDCSVCPYAMWNGSSKPECNLKYNFLGIVMETRQPFLMSVGGASFKQAKLLINKCVRTKKPLYNYIIKLVPELVIGGKGKYYIYILNTVREATVEEIEEFSVYKQDFTSKAKVQEDSEFEPEEKNKKEETENTQEELPTIEIDNEGEVEGKEDGPKIPF